MGKEEKDASLSHTKTLEYSQTSAPENCICYTGSTLFPLKNYK